MSIEIDTDVDYLQTSDTEGNGDQTKCAEILVSFSSFAYEFVCILCRERRKYTEFQDYIDHVREEHVPEHSEDEYVEIYEEESYHSPESPTKSKSYSSDVEMLDFTDGGTEQHMIDLLDMYRKCLGLWHKRTADNTSNEEKMGALKLLLEKHSSQDSDQSMDDLLNRLKSIKDCYFTEKGSSAVGCKKWYLKLLNFLEYTEVEEVPDSEFDDYSCPWCTEYTVAVSTRARDLWMHIITNHIRVEHTDPLAVGQSKVFTLQWPEENILLLIDLYRDQECLWNVKSRLYHNRSFKADAYRTIIERYNELYPNFLKDRDAVKEAIKHLRDYFGRVDKKFQTSNAYGVLLPLNKYKIYEKLLFIKNVCKSRRTPTVSTFSCELCGETFNKKKDLNAHRSEHATAVFTCEKCPLRFVSQINLEAHRKEHLRCDGKTYACPICHSNFSNSEDLAAHLNDHLPKNLQRQICDICGAKFDDRSNLLIHIRRHTNTKNYACDICHKRFVTSSELKSHVVVHSNERPFVCEVCGLRFKYSNRLNTHQLFHGEPKLSCMSCDMKFVTRRHLTEHQRIHSPPEAAAEKISCRICGSLFRNADSLSRHERKIHNIKKRDCDRLVFCVVKQ